MPNYCTLPETNNVRRRKLPVIPRALNGVTTVHEVTSAISTDNSEFEVPANQSNNENFVTHYSEPVKLFIPHKEKELTTEDFDKLIDEVFHDEDDAKEEHEDHLIQGAHLEWFDAWSSCTGSIHVSRRFKADEDWVKCAGLETTTRGQLVALTMATTAEEICKQEGWDPDAFFVQVSFSITNTSYPAGGLGDRIQSWT